MPNFYHKFVNCWPIWRTYSTNLLHCFNDGSLDYRIVRARNVLLWPVHRRKGTLSINALSTALCWRPCQMSNSSSTLWTPNWYTRC